MNYTDWKKTIPEAIERDALWRHKVYRLALFVSDTSWGDVNLLYRD